MMPLSVAVVVLIFVPMFTLCQVTENAATPGSSSLPECISDWQVNTPGSNLLYGNYKQDDSYYMICDGKSPLCLMDKKVIEGQCSTKIVETFKRLEQEKINILNPAKCLKNTERENYIICEYHGILTLTPRRDYESICPTAKRGSCSSSSGSNIDSSGVSNPDETLEIGEIMCERWPKNARFSWSNHRFCWIPRATGSGIGIYNTETNELACQVRPPSYVEEECHRDYFYASREMLSRLHTLKNGLKGATVRTVLCQKLNSKTIPPYFVCPKGDNYYIVRKADPQKAVCKLLENRETDLELCPNAEVMTRPMAATTPESSGLQQLCPSQVHDALSELNSPDSLRDVCVSPGGEIHVAQSDHNYCVVADQPLPQVISRNMDELPRCDSAVQGSPRSSTSSFRGSFQVEGSSPLAQTSSARKRIISLTEDFVLERAPAGSRIDSVKMSSWTSQSKVPKLRRQNLKSTRRRRANIHSQRRRSLRGIQQNARKIQKLRENSQSTHHKMMSTNFNKKKLDMRMERQPKNAKLASESHERWSETLRQLRRRVNKRQATAGDEDVTGGIAVNFTVVVPSIAVEDQQFDEILMRRLKRDAEKFDPERQFIMLADSLHVVKVAPQPTSSGIGVSENVLLYCVGGVIAGILLLGVVGIGYSALRRKYRIRSPVIYNYNPNSQILDSPVPHVKGKGRFSK